MGSERRSRQCRKIRDDGTGTVEVALAIVRVVKPPVAAAEGVDGPVEMVF